jgi:1-acyl-sn-glycerol-3-phosphate acyltransferase
MSPIGIDRGNPMQALTQIKSLSQVRLQQGKNILVFPEGTRKPVGHLGSYKRSAADIAQQGNVPLIPVANNGG